MPAIQLLSFDLDDTLWPCMPVIEAAEQTLYAWLQHHVPVICQRYSIAQLRQQRRAMLQQNPQWAHDLSLLRRQSLRALDAEFGLGGDWVEPAFEVFHRARQQVRLFDDVAPVLDALKGRYRLLALSNGNADIEQTGVARWFEFSLHAAEAGCRKSDPAIYRMALQRAGVAPARAVHIGDDPVQDVQGARLAGMKTVWLNRACRPWTQPFRPDAEIGDLHALPDALDTLVRL